MLKKVQENIDQHKIQLRQCLEVRIILRVQVITVIVILLLFLFPAPTAIKISSVIFLYGLVISIYYRSKRLKVQVGMLVYNQFKTIILLDNLTKTSNEPEVAFLRQKLYATIAETAQAFNLKKIKSLLKQGE